MKNVTTQEASATHIHIVFAGCCDITVGAYKKLYHQLKQEVDSGIIRFTVVSPLSVYACMSLMHECLAGDIDAGMLEIPLRKIFTNALLMQGRVQSNNLAAKKLQIEMLTGDTMELPYDYMIDGKAAFAEDANCKPYLGFTVRTAADLHTLRLKAFELVEKAARAKDKFSAARLLRVAIAGNGVAGVELAASLANCFTLLCKQFGLSTIKPTIYLVLHNAALYEAVALNRRLEQRVNQHFYKIGVRVLKGRQMIRTNTDGIVLDDGSFVNCSFVINTGQNLPETQKAGFSANRFGQFENSFCYTAVSPFSYAMQEPSGFLACQKQGKALGYNVYAAITKNTQQPIKVLNIKLANLGAGCSFLMAGSLAITGWFAAICRLYILFFTLPVANNKQYKYSLLNTLKIPIPRYIGKVPQKVNLASLFSLRSELSDYPTTSNPTASVSKLNITS